MKEWPIILLGVAVLAGIAVWQWHERVPWPGWPWAGPPLETYVPEPGDPPSLLDGIRAYDDGEYEKAKAQLMPLADGGNVKAINIVGLMHDFGKGYPENYELACDWYEKAAKEGYARSQSNLAICYGTGSGRKKAYKKWYYWVLLAAKQGSKGAQNSLASYFVGRDRDKYLYWGKAAVANGSTKINALMWSNGDDDLVPALTAGDFACIAIVFGIMDGRYDACDEGP